MAAGIHSDDYMVSGSGVMPWHGTNVTVLDGNPTAQEALTAAKLAGWNLSKQPVFFEANGRSIEVPRHFAVVRETDNKALGIVQQRYQILQNEDAFGWADALVGGGGAHYETAGSLKGGRIVYLTLNTPFAPKLPNGDTLKTYLLISNRHDGGGAVTVAIVTVRVVCSNTLAMAIGGAQKKVSIKHTLSLPARMDEAQKVLGLAEGAANRAEEIATKLLAQKMTDQKFEKFLDLLLLPGAEEPTPRQATAIEKTREAITTIYRQNPTEDNARGTAWGAYNAVSFYHDHVTPRREMTEGDGSPADQRMLAILAGNNIGDRAYDILSDGLGGGRWLTGRSK